jgi:hypothetical protein
MKRQKLVNVLFTLCFLCFLFVGMAATVLKPKAEASFFENRALAAVPVLSRPSLMSGEWFSGWETYLKDHAPGRDTLLKAAAALDLFVIGRPVVNDIVVSDIADGGNVDGDTVACDLLLSDNGYKTVDAVKIADQSAEMADRLAALDAVVRDCGGSFLTVAVPGQTAYFADGYPAYLSNNAAYTDTVLKCFKSDMAARGVPLVDMGDVFDAMGHPASLYSAADHHFTMEGAYTTYAAMIDRLNSDGLSIPVLTDGDLTFTTLQNPFLGSRARKIFNLIPASEKLMLAIPNVDIPLTRTDDGKENTPFIYSLPKNTWDAVTYNVYMGGDVGETIINTNRPQLPNVLLVGDSYTNAVECLLYMSFNEMRSLDLRSYKGLSLTDYVRAYRPDAVILLRDYSVLLSPDGNGNIQ